MNVSPNYGKGQTSKKPPKQEFGARSPKSPQLSDLAQELGDMMKKTEKKGLEVGEVKLPVVKAKKFAPVFSKKA